MVTDIEAPRKALTASASADWGSPELIYRLAHAVMLPVYGEPIDLDASSSEYWQEQWPEGTRPRFHFDGISPVTDTLHPECHWHRIARDSVDSKILPPTVFDNPPGDSSGETVQEFYRVLAERHASKLIASLFWVGFSLEQLTSLQGTTEIDPLHRDACTIIPSRRTRYRVHPQRMLEIVIGKIAKRMALPTEEIDNRLRCKAIDAAQYPSQVGGQLRQAYSLIGNIMSGNLAPVVGDAPTHASYFTILWHRESRTRRKQQSALRAFLKDQAAVPRSLFERCRVIGRIDT